MNPEVESELLAKVAELQAEIAELRAALAAVQALLLELVEKAEDGKPPHIARPLASSHDGSGYSAEGQQHYGSEQSAELQQWLRCRGGGAAEDQPHQSVEPGIAQDSPPQG